MENKNTYFETGDPSWFEDKDFRKILFEKNWFGRFKHFKNLGKVHPYNSWQGDQYVIIEQVHTLCMEGLNVGKTNNDEIFKFCPRCLLVIQEFELKIM